MFELYQEIVNGNIKITLTADLSMIPKYEDLELTEQDAVYGMLYILNKMGAIKND